MLEYSRFGSEKMKDYSMGENPNFILNYEVKKGKIYIHHPKKIEILEYTEENEKQILETMKKQVLELKVEPIFAPKAKISPKIFGGITIATHLYTSRLMYGIKTEFTKMILCFMTINGLDYTLICFLLNQITLSMFLISLFSSLLLEIEKRNKGLDALKNSLFTMTEQAFKETTNMSFDEYIKQNPEVLKKLKQTININEINLNTIDKLKDTEVQMVVREILTDVFVKDNDDEQIASEMAKSLVEPFVYKKLF